MEKKIISILLHNYFIWDKQNSPRGILSNDFVFQMTNIHIFITNFTVGKKNEHTCGYAFYFFVRLLITQSYALEVCPRSEGECIRYFLINCGLPKLLKTLIGYENNKLKTFIIQW